jgi:hypothetical protein
VEGFDVLCQEAGNRPIGSERRLQMQRMQMPSRKPKRKKSRKNAEEMRKREVE